MLKMLQTFFKKVFKFLICFKVVILVGRLWVI